MSNVQFTSVLVEETGQQFLTVLADNRLLPPVDSTHPNFATIKDACQRAFDGENIDTDWLLSLFDVAQTIADRFERLSERVSVKNGTILIDGDPADGTLENQILSFLDQGEDFAPLVNFYEKLLTNPLGDVKAGLFDWMRAQQTQGNFTITPDGDVLGYKAVEGPQAPEWRTDESAVYVPSRRGEGVVNGIDVAPNKYIEQVPGDVVEMPRSRVLHAPSQACGDGLHIGTWGYASTFLTDGQVMLVRFSPRDIVSVPDSTADHKLRVCRYTVIGPVSEALTSVLYSPEGADEPQTDLDLTLGSDGHGTPPFSEGDRVVDEDGDEATVTSVDWDEDYDEWATTAEYDNEDYGDETATESEGWWTLVSEAQPSRLGVTNGRHPAQDAAGRFSNGRPGSQRDPHTGRFA